MSVAGFLDYTFRRIFGLRVMPQARYEQLTALEKEQEAKLLPPLSNDRLLQLAATRRPPQSWYDETASPFEPANR
jgi:hypothetical protein